MYIECGRREVGNRLTVKDTKLRNLGMKLKRFCLAEGGAITGFKERNRNINKNTISILKRKAKIRKNKYKTNS